VAYKGITFRYEGKLQNKQVLHLTNEQSRTSSGSDIRTWRWACKDPATQENLQKKSLIYYRTVQTTVCQMQLTVNPSRMNGPLSLCSSIMKLTAKSLGFSSKKHQDWLVDQQHDIISLLHEKNDAQDALLRNPNSASLRQSWKELRNKVPTDIRQMENKWWTQKAEEIQRFADTNDSQRFYEALKTLNGPTQHAAHPVKSKDGTKVIEDHEGSSLAWLSIIKNYSTVSTQLISL